ncbi:uncharacterized protein VTP21DRAFT_226 [Calcarisporiella thermophila]|uniref:uncharacterized protein n=1 Tax=Calcarisporiella thermophila TaxID=911321 RepID=UPI00374485AE
MSKNHVLLNTFHRCLSHTRTFPCGKGLQLSRLHTVNAARSASSSHSTTKRHIILHSYPTDPLSVYNRKLDHLSSKSFQANAVFRICEQIKSQGLKPDLITYNALLRAYQQLGDTSKVMQTLEEMRQVGISPTIGTYTALLQACAKVGDPVQRECIIRLMKDAGFELNQVAYEHIIDGMCNNEELEHALSTLAKMESEGIQPSLQTFIRLIRQAVDFWEPEVAMRLLRKATETYVEVYPSLYLEVLRVCAYEHEVEGVLYCWQKAVRVHKIRPDQGLCLLVLNCAARLSHPQLAKDVIKHLGETGVACREHHLAPLLQALAQSRDWKSAMSVLEVMRKAGITPSLTTATPLVKSIGRDSHSLDQAIEAAEQLCGESKHLDITAFNSLIRACANVGTLDRAVELWGKEKKLGVTPDVDTYNALLDACIQARDRVVGDKIVAEMRERGVAPSVKTYTKLVTLACTQVDYEDAFTFLEEIKSHGVVPPEHTYVTLIKKLARAKDSRCYVALEEMEAVGYKAGKGLREFVETGGLNVRERARRSVMEDLEVSRTSQEEKDRSPKSTRIRSKPTWRSSEHEETLPPPPPSSAKLEL